MPDGGVLISWRQWSTTFDDYADLAVARLGPGGVLDSGFGTGGTFRWRVPEGTGIVTTTPTGMVLIAWSERLLPDDVYNYSATHRVLRLTVAGSPDPTFGTGGVATVDGPSTSSLDRVLGLGATGELPLLLVLARPDGRTQQRLVRITTSRSCRSLVRRERRGDRGNRSRLRRDRLSRARRVWFADHDCQRFGRSRLARAGSGGAASRSRLIHCVGCRRPPNQRIFPWSKLRRLRLRPQ